MNTKVQNVAPAIAAKRYATGQMITPDGTIISYRQLGQGPGLVIVHGAMSSAHNHMQLAEALADAFTVYLLAAVAASAVLPARRTASHRRWLTWKPF